MAIDWMTAIQLGSQLAGKIAEGRAKGRQAEAQTNMGRDQVASNQYGIAQNAQMDAADLDLRRQQYVEDARAKRAKQAVIGDLLANIQDVNVSVPGITNATVTGGIRPSALSDLGREGGRQLNQQALLRMLQGDEFTGGEMLSGPGLTALPKGNTADSILGALGTYGSLAGAVLPSLIEQKGTYTPNIPQIGAQAGMPQQMPGQPIGPPQIPPPEGNFWGGQRNWNLGGF
jgi:hypothetical protein